MGDAAASNDMRVVDLEAVVAAVSLQEERVRFASLVRRYHDAMSALNDLRDCQEHLEALARHDPLQPADNQQHHLISGALLSQAIILYVRAAKTTSKHRTPLPLRAKMPLELVSAHERMVALRDNAIAHFGPGPGGNRPAWIRERTALRVHSGRADLRFLYSRVAIQTDVPRDLERLVVSAIERTWRIAEERAAHLLTETARLYDADPPFRGALGDNEIDLNSFFDGDLAAIAQTRADGPERQLGASSYQRSEFPLS